VVRVGAASVAASRRNHLLAGLDETTLASLVARAEHVRLDERAAIYEAGDPIAHVDFPLHGLVSIVASSHDGSTVEVGPVGCDGMVGLPVFLGGETDPLEAFVQVDPVEAIRVPTQAFKELVEAHLDLDRVMRRYVQWTYYGMAQWVLCARLHPIEERMGRWLLMCHDRLGQDHFRLTHEYLAQMLGVRRPSVTIAAGVLRKSGLIEYQRGVVTILDRPRLDEAACECNRVTAAEYRRLIGRGPEADRLVRPAVDGATLLSGNSAVRASCA
jgi:CRP-like cAMP-binding protein